MFGNMVLTTQDLATIYSWEKLDSFIVYFNNVFICLPTNVACRHCWKTYSDTWPTSHCWCALKTLSFCWYFLELPWMAYSTSLHFQESIHHHWLCLLPRLCWMDLLSFDFFPLPLLARTAWFMAWPRVMRTASSAESLGLPHRVLRAVFVKLATWLRWNTWLMSKRMLSKAWHRQVSWMFRMQTHISKWLFTIQVSYFYHWLFDPGRNGDAYMGPWTEGLMQEVTVSVIYATVFFKLIITNTLWTSHCPSKDVAPWSDLPANMMEKFTAAAGSHSKKLGAQKLLELKHC